MFPPLSGVQNQPSTHQEFSTFAFWREPIVDLRLNRAIEDDAKAVASNEAASATSEQQQPEQPAILPVVDAAVKKDKDEKAAAAASTAQDN